ncbi:hypothetical protein CO154_01975 [Candidatus Pacearchaeota archaeon CG_4_9_14_3_um_filter_31_7]|nr:MAG: hypothetical protein AUJ10_01505 [Candidatus Pacearchaeota archaeon CG1_02_31_27]PIN92645.1 MAG: hypothetical protein COU55_00520 [Candidatus Pacearchaeota archaeon CG10_big_fil_rev_8_21_14_0_10_31_59]PIZ81172.1 MAG: hypothetical protein COX99_00280 [Candidatus Pacearchaeota archaeon CG_4_10_14_0_2_um_filter_31_10]PJA70613.1 MAG: hypothetical protein CO154_01975 [Candidatus Pacearchaeota archaeon CG_4_9_14_3_um_filter_31_7]
MKNKSKRDNWKLAVLVIGVLLIVGITFTSIQITNLNDKIAGFASTNDIAMCTDSDGGAVLTKQGVCYSSLTDKSYGDECIADPTGGMLLKEYYCRADKVCDATEYKCENNGYDSCSNSACQ